MVLIALLLSATAAAAPGPKTYTITSPSCPILELKGGKWKRIGTAGKRAGTTITGSQKGKYVTLSSRDRQFLMPLACLREAAASRPDESASSSRPPAAPATSTSPSYWLASIGFLPLTESLDLIKSSGETYSLRAQTNALCPGIAWHLPLGRAFEFSAGGFAILGLSQVSETTSQETGPIRYRANGSQVFGGAVFPAILWNADAPGFQIGVSAPVFARYGSWPDASDGEHRVSDKFLVTPAGFIESRLRGESWGIGLRSGFYRGFKNLTWMLSTELRL